MELSAEAIIGLVALFVTSGSEGGKEALKDETVFLKVAWLRNEGEFEASRVIQQQA
ncbi:hypothetical protein VF21_08719 [Pseudogymnoascus sp. 05NY08]|nr:hypothetical protein VF21_08719 [Pseudogymnoascus sp. 05NY08]